MAPGVLPVPLGSGDEALYPDGNILKKDKDSNVHLRHEDLDIYSNTSIFFQKENWKFFLIFRY